MTDARGNTFYFAYDALNRLERITVTWLRAPTTA
jgi:YD repeat-containing protein